MSPSVSAARTWPGLTTAACSAPSWGTKISAPVMASASDTKPATGRIEPSRPSSPTAPKPRSASGASWPDAASTHSAMGKSRAAPCLRRPVGARLTVTRRSGHFRPVDRTAARTRSRDSRHDASGKPTSV